MHVRLMQALCCVVWTCWGIDTHEGMHFVMLGVCLVLPAHDLLHCPCKHTPPPKYTASHALTLASPPPHPPHIPLADPQPRLQAQPGGQRSTAGGAAGADHCTQPGVALFWPGGSLLLQNGSEFFCLLAFVHNSIV